MGFLLSLLLLALLNIHTVSAGAAIVDPAKLPLSTMGKHIVDTDGNRVKWACVNWYGPNLPDTNVVGGLEYQTLEYLVNSIKHLGYNCVRLPYTVELALEDPPVPLESALPVPPLNANPDLLGLSSLEVFDKTVEALTDAGLMIILNVHTSAQGWCCQLDSDEGIWFTPEWTYAQFEQSLTDFTTRYLSNPLVVAMDMRNEIHDINNPDRGDSIPVGWGRGDPELDWYKVATDLGNKVLAVNPDILIVVTALCFGMDLRGCKDTGAVELDVANKLIWTVHSYRFFTPFYDIPLMLNLKDYRDLAAISGFSLVGLLVIFIAVIKTTWPSKKTWTHSVVLTWAVMGCFFVPISYGVAETLKETCNTWYHNDAKNVPPIGIAIFLVPLLGYAGWHVWQWKKVEEKDGSTVLELSNMTGGGTKESADLFKGEAGTSIYTMFLLPPALASLLFFGIMLFTCMVWSLFATTPMVYENHHTRMWWFASEEGKGYQAPIWMSEFGQDTRDAYWVGLMKFLAKEDMDWAVWAYYGSTRVEAIPYEHENTTMPETYGLMNKYYNETMFAGLEGGDWRIQDMQAVMGINPNANDIDVKGCSDCVW
ncbi:hypothetical protein TrLO_g8803 [Triparma laevis f. longispina]|uniref:Glycoside hydrolase family 5 domain-containing protein n=1 Tax=Triparma laevis f. longispina TaxID=1714387 RepID=A0A9W7EDP8_9STRA|nr:hypothetical protein TrLO_g8803 [Triparma laevis f. longispina]